MGMYGRKDEIDTGKMSVGNHGRRKKSKEWLGLSAYILGEGVERYLECLKDLPDKEYIKEFREILEYFKPRARDKQANDDNSRMVLAVVSKVLDEKPNRHIIDGEY